MTAPVAPTGAVELARALAVWRQVQGGLVAAARAYADALEVEARALTVYVRAVADGADGEQVSEARTALATALGVRDLAAGRLGVTVRPMPAARAAQALLRAARAAGAGVTS